MRNKKSFILYRSYRTHFEKLSDEQLGKLIRGIFDYVENDTVPILDPVSDMAFSFVRDNLDRDSDKWEKEKKKRREAGRLGGIRSGEVRRSKTKQNEAMLRSAKQNEANEADNVNVNVNGNVNVNDIVNKGFNIFWKKYPRKIGKKKAQQKYKLMAKSKKKVDEIQTGLDRYVKKWESDQTSIEFIPHPATWLNQERWNDDIESETKPKYESKGRDESIKQTDDLLARYDKLKESKRINKLSESSNEV